MGLADALTAYDRVALNLDKLDKIWQQIEELIPEGPFLSAGSDDEVHYADLAGSWTAIANSLPAINGWRITAKIIDYAGIGQARLDYLDIDEPEALRQFDTTVYAPRTEARTYRYKLVRARQELVRQRAQQLLAVIDAALAEVPTAPDEQFTPFDAAIVLDQVREAFNELERLLGDALNGAPRHGDLRRHLRFAEPHDTRDIATMDWPAVRAHLELAIYGDDAPVPVDVADLGILATQTGPTPVPSQIHWDRLDADGFERLLARLLESSGSYTSISRYMNVNAPDAGRDLQAYRVVSDGLLTERRDRVILQAKHWSSKSIAATDIADVVHAKLPLWEGEPVRVLIFATTGTFTQDAVRWVETHNNAGNRPEIILWSSAELEALLRRWPALLAEFGVVG